MKQRLILIMFLLLMGGWPTKAQINGGNITAAGSTCTTTNACVFQAVPSNSANASISILGTFSATLQFEVLTSDGAVSGVLCTPPNATPASAVTSTTSTGIWDCPVSSKAIIRVRCSSYSSGNAGVTINPFGPPNTALVPGSGGGGGSGTVTSVTFTGDGIVDSSTPSTAVTTSGTVTATPLTQSANRFLAGPTTGSAANPTFRALVSADIPNNAASTTGSAAKWTTPRNLAGNSVDGSANVLFANGFIVQGMADAGLTGAFFMGSLATGLVKNTTTTGVPSIATAGTDYVVPSGSITGNAATATALAATPTLCTTGQAPTGILASGNATGCAAYTQTIASGTAALGTGAISSGTCATVVTVTATGVATTDDIMSDFNADPTSTTGYSPSANGMLTIIKYPTSGNVNFKVCNNTASSVTPGAVTLNWRVVR